jgi:Ca2+-binding RTX toxin-like protein
MAVFTYGDDLPPFASVHELYDLDSLELIDEGATQAIFEDENGYQIILIGAGFTYSSGVMTGGTVTGLNFLDDVGGDLLSVTGTNFSVLELIAQFEDQPDLWEFLKLLTSGNDTFHGNENGTVISLSEDHGDDEVFCGDGGSYVGGSKGNDNLHGGADWDTLSFEETYWRNDATLGIILNAAKGTVRDSWGDKDTFDGFEEYGGSKFKDLMTGSKRNEAFMGLQGKDTIDGGKGSDEIRYHNDDRYEGDGGINANLAKGVVVDGFGDKDTVSNVEGIVGTNEADKFVGSKANNFFIGLDGVDSYDGGKGEDIARFFYWNDIGQGGIIVDMTLATGQVINDGFGNTETMKRIEGIDGSQFDDDIKLGKANGWIYADAGDDRLEAGTGQQWFSGGDGQDTFVFGALNTLGNKDTRDQIDDFNQGQGDQIDLSGIGGLFFGGEGAFSGEEGEIRYTIADEKTIIAIDTDGNGKADFQIQVNRAVEFEEGDFILSL